MLATLARIVRLSLGWTSPSLMFLGVDAVRDDSWIDRWERRAMMRAAARGAFIGRPGVTPQDETE